MASIESRLIRFSQYYVLIPALILVVLLNFLVAYLVMSRENESTFRDRERAEADFRSALVRTQSDLFRFAAHPILQKALRDSDALYQERTQLWVASLIAAAQPTAEQQGQIDAFTTRHPVTRLALDTGEIPGIRSILLTDHIGRLVAADRMPPEPNLSVASWWQESKRRGFQEVLVEGVTSRDTFYINMPIFLNPANRSADGVLRVEIPLSAILAHIPLDAYRESVGLAFLRQGAVEDEVHAIGRVKEVLEGHALRLVQHVRGTGTTSGWFKGARFSARTVELRDTLDTSLNVIAFSREPLVDARSLSPLVICVLASAVLVVVLNMFGQRAALQVGEAVADITNAGQWLLWRVDPNRFTHVVGKAERSILQNPGYNQWLEGVKQSVLDTMVSHEHEVQRDLQLARDFQYAYHNRPYPRVPVNHLPGRLRLKFSHYYQPALALGGDFFEISSLAPDVAGLMICDVMGHGTRSALITSMLRTLMADLKGQGRNTRNFLREMNRGFYGMLQQLNLPHPLFASAYYFVADTTARAATFSTAGHPAPFHIRRSANTVDRLQVAPPHGAALGVSLDEDYTGGSCRLNAGDVFLFYTDGVYEAFSPHGEEFGLRRLELFMRQCIHLGLDQIVEALKTTLSDFTEHEPLRDDICILAMEVTDEAEHPFPSKL